MTVVTRNGLVLVTTPRAIVRITGCYYISDILFKGK